MNRVKYLLFLSDFNEFKIIKDETDAEYVVFKNSVFNRVENIKDKTEFEAVENHVHIFDKINKKEFCELEPVAHYLGKSLLCILKQTFPDKQFFVYVAYKLHDSLIIRFHQKWKNEPPYYDNCIPGSENEKILIFE